MRKFIIEAKCNDYDRTCLILEADGDFPAFKDTQKSAMIFDTRAAADDYIENYFWLIDTSAFYFIHVRELK